MTSLAFLRENNKNEEEGIKTLRRENNKNEEEVEEEEEEDSIKTWRRENNTDLTLGWTVG